MTTIPSPLMPEALPHNQKNRDETELDPAIHPVVAPDFTPTSAPQTVRRIGPYEIREQIGQGGMASVYRAWHTGLHRHEALKIPRQGTEGVDTQFIQRLLSEARLAARLHHPHIVGIHNISEDGATLPYFSMDLVEGSDLSRLLAQNGKLTPEEALPILEQAAEAIDHAHAHGVVHRDIKPENILLEPQSDGWRVKVVDFGISRAGEDTGGTRLTRSGFLVGTPEYMSPEQSGSGEIVDFHTDIYSMGVLAYEMLCGKPPFTAGDGVSRMAILISHVRDDPQAPHLANPTLNKKADEVILRAMAKEPSQRYGSAQEFVGALAEALPQATSVPSGATPRTKSVKGWPALMGAVCVGIFIGWMASMFANRDVPASANPNTPIPAVIPVATLSSGAPAITRSRRTLRREIAFIQEKRKTSSLPLGATRLQRKGRVGLQEVVLETSQKNGKEVGRKILSSRELQAPVSQVVLVGTRRPARHAAVKHSYRPKHSAPARRPASHPAPKRRTVKRSVRRHKPSGGDDQVARIKRSWRIFRWKMRRGAKHWNNYVPSRDASSHAPVYETFSAPPDFSSHHS